MKEKDVNLVVEHCAWVKSITNALFELDYIASMINTLKDTDCIVIFCGNMHAVRLIEFLKAYKFEAEYQAGNYEGSEEYLIINEYVFEPTKLISLLCNAFEISVNKCANQNCIKEGTKRCGQCKKVHYCSQECQRNAWSDHKPKCQQIAKPEKKEEK